MTDITDSFIYGASTQKSSTNTKKETFTMLRLESWVLRTTTRPSVAPGTKGAYLHGAIYGHPIYEDGTFMNTSAIQTINNGLVITVAGTAYELGEPALKYEDQYPDVKHKVLHP